MIHCTLCGEELTAPQFFEGNAYGWSCIKKVNPSHKKEQLISFENFIIKRDVVGHPESKRCIVKYNNKSLLVVGKIYNNILWVNKTQFDKIFK